MAGVTFYMVAIFIWTLVFNLVIYVWRRRHWYSAVRNMKGPFAFPILGNSYIFLCKREDILRKIHLVISRYTPGPLRFWLGPVLLVILPNADHVEKVISSSKFSTKHNIYRFPQVFLGNGLITGSGPEVKKHRRVIQPMFDLRFAKDCITYMQSHVSLCMKRLDKYCDGETFEFFDVVHSCFADIIKETVLGSKERSQINHDNVFDKAMLVSYDFTFNRMVRPWLHPNFIFNCTPLKTEQDYLLKTLRSKGTSMIKEAYRRREQLQTDIRFHPIIDKILDAIVDEELDMKEETVIDNVLTLYTASEDTMTITSSFLSMCLGMYPEYQEKVWKEIRDIIGDTPRLLTPEDVSKMEFMEMCIKETLRLFPVAPIILRKCLEDYQLDEYVIPKGAAIVIPIFSLQRDPRWWKKPDVFYPDHFLPEEENVRHPYAFIPFSAGPRGCIGKILAYTGIKVFMGNLLQKYEIECDGDVPSLKIRMDISTRPTDGCNLRLKKRRWD